MTLTIPYRVNLKSLERNVTEEASQWLFFPSFLDYHNLDDRESTQNLIGVILHLLRV